MMNVSPLIKDLPVNNKIYLAKDEKLNWKDLNLWTSGNHSISLVEPLNTAGLINSKDERAVLKSRRDWETKRKDSGNSSCRASKVLALG